MFRRKHPLHKVSERAAADISHASPALGACSAGDHPRSYHVVPLLDLRAPGTQLLDDPRALMAGHEGRGHVYLSEQVVEVGVAVAGVDIADKGFLFLRGIKLQLFDTVRLVRFPQDCSFDFHSGPPSWFLVSVRTPRLAIPACRRRSSFGPKEARHGARALPVDASRDGHRTRGLAI